MADTAMFNQRDIQRHNNQVVRKETLRKVLDGTADANIRFEDLRSLLTALGFVERVKGGHHIFARSGVMEILNLQS